MMLSKSPGWRMLCARFLALGAATLAFVWAAPTSAQDGGVNRVFAITPAFSVTQTYTDNRDLRSVAPQWELITQISPGVHIHSRSGRVQGSLDYALNAIVYAQDSSHNQLQNALRATMAAEVIERMAFLNATANVSQQNISAFAVQSNDPLSVNSNRSEVRNLTVTPVLRGRVAGEVDLEARLTYAKSNGAASNSIDSTSNTGSVSASGRSGALGWTVSTSESTFDNSGGRKTNQDSTNASLRYTTPGDLSFSLRYGRETNNVLTAQNRSNATWGLGAEWLPSPRTQVSLQADKRYFGNSHTVSVQHRLQRSLLRFSDTRSASTDDGNSQRGSAATYDELDALIRPFEPDAAKRDLLVRTLLASQGGFLSKAVTLQRRQEASYALQGQRVNLAFTAFQTNTRRLDGLSSVIDDFSLVNRLQQHGYSFNGGYQLTPTSTVTLGYNRTTTADSGVQRGNDQRGVSLSLSTRIAMRVSLSLTARHVVFDSVAQPYNESSAVASLSFQF